MNAQFSFDEFKKYTEDAQYRMSLAHKPIGNGAYELTDFAGYSSFDKEAFPIIRKNKNGSYTWIR